MQGFPQQTQEEKKMSLWKHQRLCAFRELASNLMFETGTHLVGDLIFTD